MTQRTKLNTEHMREKRESSRQTQAAIHCKPVLKKPRRQWMIPRTDAAELALQQRREEDRLRALAEGTMPHARELLRHLMWSTEQALRSGTMTRAEIEAKAAGTVAREKLLKPEWALLMAKLFHVEPARLVHGSDLLLGKVIVLYCLKELDLGQEYHPIL